MKPLKRARLPVLFAVVLATVATAAPPESGTAEANAPERARIGDVVRAWDGLVSDLLRRERQGPLAAARLIGISGVALHEAALPGLAGEPALAGRLAALPPVPPATPAIDAALSANAASARLLRGLMAKRGADALRAIDAMEARWAGASDAAPDIAAASAAHGRAVADVVLAWAETDGSRELARCPRAARHPAGSWKPTPPQFRQEPLQPCWGDLRPMALASADVPIADPPACSDDPASPFHAHAMEVFDTVNRQDPEEREIALFWADDTGATGTPPGHWLAILDQLAVDRSLDDRTFVRARAALGVALHDAAIACWRAKYRHFYVRPVTYLQRKVKASWVPLLATPPFPEYPSGHAVFSAAVASVLARTLGDGPFEDRTRASRGHASRKFASFDEAAREAAASRIYGGIHFRPACEDGLAQGRAVGAEVIRRLGL